MRWQGWRLLRRRWRSLAKHRRLVPRPEESELQNQSEKEGKGIRYKRRINSKVLNDVKYAYIVAYM